MSAMLELWVSGARDVFGHRFRDAWHVNGWEKGCVPEGYVCWLYSEWKPRSAQPVNLAVAQMELFA